MRKGDSNRDPAQARPQANNTFVNTSDTFDYTPWAPPPRRRPRRPGAQNICVTRTIMFSCYNHRSKSPDSKGLEMAITLEGWNGPAGQAGVVAQPVTESQILSLEERMARIQRRRRRSHAQTALTAAAWLAGSGASSLPRLGRHVRPSLKRAKGGKPLLKTPLSARRWPRRGQSGVPIAKRLFPSPRCGGQGGEVRGPWYFRRGAVPGKPGAAVFGWNFARGRTSSTLPSPLRGEGYRPPHSYRNGLARPLAALLTRRPPTLPSPQTCFFARVDSVEGLESCLSGVPFGGRRRGGSSRRSGTGSR